MAKTKSLEGFLAAPERYAELDLCGEWRIGGVVDVRLAQALIGNNTLTTLSLAAQGIGDKGAIIIAGGFARNNTLTTLNLAFNEIGDLGARFIGAALVSNGKLATLILGMNKIGDKGVSVIGEALIQNSTLTTLNLFMNQIGDIGARSIGKCLMQNSTLTELNLFNNKIGDAGARSIGEALGQNRALITLNLEANEVGDKGAQPIAWVLRESRVLREFSIQYNSISEELMDHIGQLMRGIDCPPYLSAEAKNYLDHVSGMVEQHRGVQNLSYLIADGDQRIYDAGEQAILIMGKTGAGKTTLAHMLTNQALRAFVNDRGQMVIEAAQALGRGRIGHEYWSETIVPNKFVAGEKVIWDCPGFDDTNVEQSVANSFYIQKLVRSSQQVMLVLAVEANFITGGGRGGAFIEVLDSFIKTFNNMEHLVGSVSLVVTHVENYTELRHMRQDILGRIEAHGTATDTMRAIIDSVIERGAIHLIRKPQAAGEYEYEPNLLGSIEDSCAYVEVEPESVNVVLSREKFTDHVPGAGDGDTDQLLEAEGGGFGKGGCCIVSYVTDVIYENEMLMRPKLLEKARIDHGVGAQLKLITLGSEPGVAEGIISAIEECGIEQVFSLLFGDYKLAPTAQEEFSLADFEGADMAGGLLGSVDFATAEVA